MAGRLWGKQVERTVKRRARVGWEGATPPTAARVRSEPYLLDALVWRPAPVGGIGVAGPGGSRASPFGKLLGKVFGGEEEAVLDRGVIQKG